MLVHYDAIFIERVPYSEKVSREKTSANFVVLWLFMKVFSAKFGDVASFGMTQESDS